MGTTEAGGGVPEELRKRLNAAVNDSLHREDGWDALVDVILSEIATAGYEVVPRELLADLIRGIIATHGCHNCAELSAGVLFDYAELGEMLERLDT